MENAKIILRKHFDADNSVDENAIINAMKEFAIEVAKESLKNASNKAQINLYDGGIEEKYHNHYVGSVYLDINKDSIVNENNIPKL